MEKRIVAFARILFSFACADAAKLPRHRPSFCQ